MSHGGPAMAAGAPSYTLRQQPPSPSFQAAWGAGRPAPMEEGKPVFMARAAPMSVFAVTGVVLLLLLCIVPVWNAAALLQDDNYRFWQGEWVPWLMIMQCGALIVLYLITVALFFGLAKPQAQTEQAVMMIANIFITLLGLSLMLVSLPLSGQATETYNSLVPQCTFNKQSHRLHEYSEVLLNIRSSPGCISQYSVEECQGYEDAPPYTSFLKTMESEFRCSGFCHQPPAIAAVPSTVTHNKTAASLLHTRMATRLQSRVRSALTMLGTGRGAPHPDPGTVELDGNLAAEAEEAEGAEGKKGAVRDARYPPTLFSDSDYKASCEGMAARDLQNFAGEVASQTYYQGVYLLIIAVVASFLKMLGICVTRDHDRDAKMTN